MIRDILTYGDSVLRRVSEPIPVGSDVNQLVTDLWDTLAESSDGMGLAAPQIGESVRAYAINYHDEKTKKTSRMLCLNPEIQPLGSQVMAAEGCLSIPGLSGHVSRPIEVKLTYYDAEWRQHTLQTNGYLARIIQHEHDHLDGILWIDRLSKSVQLSLLPQLILLRKSKTF